MFTTKKNKKEDHRWLERFIYMGVSAVIGGLLGGWLSQNNQQEKMDNTVKDYNDNPYSNRWYQ